MAKKKCYACKNKGRCNGDNMGMGFSEVDVTMDDDPVTMNMSQNELFSARDGMCPSFTPEDGAEAYVNF